MLIEDHEIDAELLHAPIFVSEKKLPNEIEIAVVIGADQDDR